MEEKWLQWASQLQSIAQAGLTFGADRYDFDRYEKIRSIAVEILHEYTDIDHKKIRELFASETGYQTPKVDIRASVFKDNRILMVKEKVDGAWSFTAKDAKSRPDSYRELSGCAKVSKILKKSRLVLQQKVVIL